MSNMVKFLTKQKIKANKVSNIEKYTIFIGREKFGKTLKDVRYWI